MNSVWKRLVGDKLIEIIENILNIYRKDIKVLIEEKRD